MSTRSHDKIVETPDNPVYDVFFFFFFFFFFCKQVFCVFSREFQHNSIKSVQCVPLDFFSNLDFGTELLLFPNCFISECSVFFFLYFNL